MTRLRAFSLIVTLFCLTTMLSACTNAVLFTTASIIGIEMNTAENGQQSLKFGYHRFEGVVMPHTLPDGGVPGEAYAVRSIFQMDTGPFLLPALQADVQRGVTITQVFATGAAATAGNGNLKARFKEIRDMFDPTPAPGG